MASAAAAQSKPKRPGAAHPNLSMACPPSAIVPKHVGSRIGQTSREQGSNKLRFVRTARASKRHAQQEWEALHFAWLAMLVGSGLQVPTSSPKASNWPQQREQTRGAPLHAIAAATNSGLSAAKAGRALTKLFGCRRLSPSAGISKPVGQSTIFRCLGRTDAAGI